MAQKYFVMLFPIPFLHSSVKIIKMPHASEEKKYIRPRDAVAVSEQRTKLNVLFYFSTEKAKE